jgi:hypothetical protein
MKLFKYSSVFLVMMGIFACKTSSEGHSCCKKTEQATKVTPADNAQAGNSSPESRAKDTPATNPRAIQHSSPDQARLDSIKQAKNASKH